MPHVPRVVHSRDRGRHALNLVPSLHPGRALARSGEAVTRYRKTHCKHGHPLAEPNLYWYEVNGNRIRQCKACKNGSRTRPPKERYEQLTLWFPAGPVIELIQMEAKRRTCDASGLVGDGFHKLRRELGLNGTIKPTSRLRWDTVDRICCALHRHPAELYPEWAA